MAKLYTNGFTVATAQKFDGENFEESNSYRF